jgi:hypothetical protein
VNLFFAFIKSAILMAGLFFANGAVVILAARYSHGAATFWSANAVLVFCLLISSRSRHLAYLLGAGTASLLLNMMAEHSLIQALANSFANIAEASLVAWLLFVANQKRTGSILPRDLLYFGGISILASAGSAGISVMALDANHWQEWKSWFASDALGLLALDRIASQLN